FAGSGDPSTSGDAPSDPITGDLYLDTDTGDLYEWDGSEWQANGSLNPASPSSGSLDTLFGSLGSSGEDTDTGNGNNGGGNTGGEWTGSLSSLSNDGGGEVV